VTEVKVAYPEVKAHANRRRVIPFPNDFKSAIVVGTPVQQGMARMFQTLNDNAQITIAIFGDDASALEWLYAPGLEPPETHWQPGLPPRA